MMILTGQINMVEQTPIHVDTTANNEDEKTRIIKTVERSKTYHQVWIQLNLTLNVDNIQNRNHR